MRIRLVRPEDLKPCGAIYSAAFAAPPYGEAWDPDDASEMLGVLLRKDPDNCWCVEIDGRVEGFAFCITYGRFRATIEEFAVAPGMQGRGLGTLLMEHVISRLRAEGIMTVDLVANRRAPAYGFYKRFGLQEPKDYVLMTRRL